METGFPPPSFMSDTGDGFHQRRPELTAAQTHVWELIAAGTGRPGEITTALGISAAAVHKHLTARQDSGHIRRAQHGIHEPAS